MSRQNDDNNIENPDDLSPEDRAAMERERARRAAWRHPSERDTPPELRWPRITDHVPHQRSGE